MWKDYNGDPDGLNTFLMALNSLKNDGVELSYQSLNILMLETTNNQLDFYFRSKDIQDKVYDTATCMTSIRRHIDEEGTPSQLLVGTEFCSLLVVSAGGDAIQEQVISIKKKFLNKKV